VVPDAKKVAAGSIGINTDNGRPLRTSSRRMSAAVRAVPIRCGRAGSVVGNYGRAWLRPPSAISRAHATSISRCSRAKNTSISSPGAIGSSTSTVIVPG
jgi:hypothetical protein